MRSGTFYLKRYCKIVIAKIMVNYSLTLREDLVLRVKAGRNESEDDGNAICALEVTGCKLTAGNVANIMSVR